MSEVETQDRAGQSQAEQDDAAGVEGTAGEQGQSAAADGAGHGQRRRSGALAWIALLLALAALAAATQPYWRQWIPGERPQEDATRRSVSNELQSLAGRVENSAGVAERNAQAIERVREELAALEGRLSTALEERPSRDFSERADQLAERLERLEGDYNTRFGGLRGRVEDLEEKIGRRLERFELRLADVGGDIDRADRDLAARLRLVEVDSLFALAQDRLAIAGDVTAARRAWRRGMERLTALEDVEFSDLKNIARREFERLEDFQPPDTAARIDRVYSIVDQIEEWPVDPDKALGSGRAPGAKASDAPTQGWRERLDSVVDGLVTIESVDRERASPAEVDLARERLQSLLQAAGFALVRGREDTAQRLIERLIDRADRHFDTSAGAVAESLQWLSGLVRDARETRVPALEDSRAEIARLLGSVR